MPRQQRLQHRPLHITQVMPLQPLIIHGTTQAETTAKIYETRSSRRTTAGSVAHPPGTSRPCEVSPTTGAAEQPKHVPAGRPRSRKSQTPNWTIGASSAATCPPLAKARNRRSGSLPISSRAESGAGSSRPMGSKFLEGASARSRRAAAAPQNPHKSGVRVVPHSKPTDETGLCGTRWHD
jgi:hypothetical protein